MKLLTQDERGWATFTQKGELTKVLLTCPKDSHVSVDLDPSTLNYFCQLIANLSYKSQKKEALLQITNVDTIKETFTLTWNKTEVWTFNTIAFLTQAAPELITTYRIYVDDLTGK